MDHQNLLEILPTMAVAANHPEKLVRGNAAGMLESYEL